MDQMPDIVTSEAIKFLRNNEIETMHPNLDVNGHLAYINQYIMEKIENVKDLIPSVKEMPLFDNVEAPSNKVWFALLNCFTPSYIDLIPPVTEVRAGLI